MACMLGTSDKYVKHSEQFLSNNVRMPLQDRIKELLSEFPNKKKAELARFCGVSRTTPTDWTSGKTKKIDGDHAYKVAEFFDNAIEPYWIQTGKGPKYKAKASDNHHPIESNAAYLGGFDVWDENTPLDDDEVALPFLREIEVAAGSGRAHQVIKNHGLKLRFAKSTLRKKSVMADNAYCVTVSGNSMEPVLPDGSTIGIDTGNKTIKNGDIYAIDHAGELRVKMVYRLPGGGLRLRSFNSDEWPDEYYSEQECAEIKILGRMFWSATLW